MKNIYLLFIIMVITTLTFAQKQNEVRGSMGIDFISSPSLTDYVEYYTGPLSTFNSAVNFSGAYGRMISPNDQLEVELGYLLNSYNSSSTDGTYDLSYSIIMPSLIYYYVLNGAGYYFKFGAGAGARFLSVTEKLPGYPNDNNYSSLGYGFIVRVAGNTAISKDVYAYIAADVRYDINGEPDNNGNKLYNYTYNENVNFNSLSLGVRLGLSYQF